MNATERMIEVVTAKGFTRDEAQKIVHIMIRMKAMKFDSIGQLKVTHGALLDASCLRNALKLANEKCEIARNA